jgi:hypothetical protein
MGPLTTSKGEREPVETAASRIMKGGDAIACTAAMRTGRCSGLQPAMAALMAIFSTVARPKVGSRTATTS